MTVGAIQLLLQFYDQDIAPFLAWSAVFAAIRAAKLSACRGGPGIESSILRGLAD
jgi:hypothetical protein